MRALPARASCAHARDPARGLDGGGGAHGGRATGEREQAALGTVLAAAHLRRHGAARGRARTARTTKRASCGWRAPRRPSERPPLRERAGRGRGRPRSCSGAPAPGSPGWLVRCLDEFAAGTSTSRKIESRPRRERLGSYMFFADLDRPRTGASRWPRRSRACAALCEEVRVLGSYRAARPASAERLLRRARPPRRRQPPRYTARRTWRAQSHQSRWGPCRLQSTSGADLRHRPQRRWVAGCSFSTRPTSRSTCARCAARWCCC